MDTAETGVKTLLEVGDKIYVYNNFGNYYNSVGVIWRVNKKFAFTADGHKIRRESSAGDKNVFYSVDYKTRFEKETSEILITNKTKEWYYTIGTISRRMSEKRIKLDRHMRIEVKQKFIERATSLCEKLIKVEKELDTLVEDLDNGRL